jgi:formylmethanofuran dehydrogenase subunit C
MCNGSIRIKGNAGKEVGSEMSGGEIHLEGDFKSISKHIPGGRIFHKGKRIH